MKGYLKDNILYEGVTIEKPDCYRDDDGDTDFDCPECRPFWLQMKCAKKLPAIGFPEGHEGVVEYETGWQRKPLDDSEEWSNCGEFTFKLMKHWPNHRRIVAIPLPEKEASTQPVEPDCAGHKKDVAGISDMKALAEMIGDLHYESLSHLMVELGIKMYRDSNKDNFESRERLAHYLMEAQYKIQEASGFIYKAWQISKPHMKPERT